MNKVRLHNTVHNTTFETTGEITKKGWKPEFKRDMDKAYSALCPDRESCDCELFTWGEYIEGGTHEN